MQVELRVAVTNKAPAVYGYVTYEVEGDSNAAHDLVQGASIALEKIAHSIIDKVLTTKEIPSILTDNTKP